MRPVAYIETGNVDERSREWLDTLRRELRPRPHLQLELRRCALLVIDVNRYFCEPGQRAYLPAASAVLPKITRLIEQWGAGGGSVIFTQHGHTGPDDLGMFGTFFNDWIRADEPAAALLPDLPVRSDHLVVPKTTYDAFYGTELAQLLAAHGCTQVAITGVLTHMCCETTARSAFCRGLEVYGVVDAMATSTEALHLGSLRAMGDAFAVLMSTQEVLERCA